MDAEVYPSNQEKANEIRKQVAISGAKLLLIKQKHLGSDHLPEYIEGICQYLEKNNVTLIDRANVTDIKTLNENTHEVTYLTGQQEATLTTTNVIVSTR